MGPKPKVLKMTISFSITTNTDFDCDLSAVLQRGQLEAFLTLLHAEERRSGTPHISTSGPLESLLHDGFEVRVCPFPLATITGPFNDEPDVAGVIEDAQTRGRKITIWRDGPSGPIRICPSMTSDADAEFSAPLDDGFALLGCFGMTNWNERERPAGEILRALAQPATRDRMTEQNVARYIPDLERLLATARYDATSRFGWI